MYTVKRFNAIIVAGLILLLLGRGFPEAHGFTLEEVADLGEMMNQQLELKGTWQEVTRTSAHFTELLFMDKSKGWPSESMNTAQTEDGGLHWKVGKGYLWKDEPWTRWGSHVTSPESSIFTGAFFVSAQIGWWRLPSGTLLRTTDGGGSWKKLKIPRPIFVRSGFNPKTIWFADEQNGWIYTDDGGIYRTRDGGDRWEKGTHLFDQPHHFRSMRFLNARTGYLVGKDMEVAITRLPGGRVKEKLKWSDGLIYYTHDGGATWKRPETSFRIIGPKGIDLADVAIVSEKEAWVVGSLPDGKNFWIGTVWHTTDGGAHWEMVVTGVPEYFNSVVVVEQKGKPALLILSQAGKVYRMKLNE